MGESSAEGMIPDINGDSETDQQIVWKNITEEDGFTPEQIAILETAGAQVCVKNRDKYVPEVPEDDTEFIHVFNLDKLGITTDDPESLRNARVHIGNLVGFAKEHLLKDKFTNHEERIPWVQSLSDSDRLIYEATPNQSRNGRLIRVHSAFQWMVLRSRRRDPDLLAFITPQYEFMAGVAVGAESGGIKYQDITDPNQMVTVVRKVVNRVEDVFGRMTGVDVKNPSVPKTKVT